VVIFTALPPYRREKGPSYTLDRRRVGPQIQDGGCGEAKNLALLGIEKKDRAASSTSLYRLSYPDSEKIIFAFKI
jgi:hypothetical protein